MARRVNTRFLIILTSVVVGGGGTAFMAAKIVKRLNNDPEKILNEGRALVTAENWDDAVPMLWRAFQLSNRDVQIPVEIGTVYERKAVKERDPRESIQRSRAAFQAALEIDQGYLPALRKLLDSYKAELTLDPRPQAQRNVIDVADKILAVSPEDHEAIVAKESATIRTWLSGVTTESSVIDQSLANLKATLAKNPTDAKPLEAITQVYYRRAVEAARATRTDRDRLAEARKEMAALAAILEKALSGQEANPAMALQVARGYMVINEVEPDPTKSAEYDARVKSLLAAAHKDLKPTDPSYVDVSLDWAEQLRRTNDKGGVEKVLKDLIKEVPHAPAPRRALFRVLAIDPARRNEAIALALEPLPIATDATAFDVLISKENQDQLLLDATNLRTEVYASSTDEQERAKLKGEIDAAIASMTEKRGESAALLRVKGRFQLIQGQNVEAIGTLNQALTLLNQAAAPKDYDLIFQLGRAYVATKQTGQAKAMFQQIIERAPDFVPARAQLAQLYLGDNQANEALVQLDALEKLAPGSVDVMRLRFQAYVIQGKRDEALAIFNKLPQETKLDRLAKAQFALQLNDRPQAIAILTEAAKAFPKEVDVTVNLAQLLAAANEVDKAKAAVSAGLAANPDNQALQMLQLRLAGESREAVIQFAETEVGKVSDPFARQLQLAELARSQGDLDKALTELAEAEKVKPGTAEVADGLFSIYLAQQKFPEAEKQLPALVKANKDQANGLVYRFRLARAQDKRAEAESIGLELTTKMPAFAQSWVCYGQALQASGKIADAIEKFQRALERQNSNADAFRGLIDCYYLSDKPDDAQRYIATARRAYPNDPTFREAELNHTQTYGNPATVLPARREILAADPERAANWQLLAGAYIRTAQFNATRVDGKKEVDANLKEARELLVKAVAKWPAERAFAALLADVAMMQNDPALAEKTLNDFAAQPAWKGKAEPKLMLAEFYARTNRLDEAEDAFNAALKRTDNAVEVRQRAAAFLAGRGKVVGALELLPATDPSDQVRRQRINILSAAGQFKEAEEAVRASLAQDPDSIEMQALLASTYLDQRRFEDALAQVETVLKKDPKNQMALYVRGLTKLRQPSPEPDAAIADLALVSSVAPQNVDVRLALADAYRMRNDTEQAIRTLASGLQAAPLNKSLRLRLLDLYVTGNRRSEVDALLRESATLAPLQVDPEWLSAEANAWAARENYDKAAERMKAALAVAPNNANLTNAYINLLLRGRNYKAAITEADKVVVASDAWWAHQAKGIAKKSLNDRDGATTDFTLALRSAERAGYDDGVSAVISAWAANLGVDEAIEQLKPRLDAGVRWKLLAASLYLNKRDGVKAREMLDAAMAGYDTATEADQLQLLRFAGSFYLSVLPAEPEKAQAAYERLLQRTPNDLAALNNMACLLAESVMPPQPEKALTFSSRAYEQLRRMGQFDPMVYDTQGWILILSGQVDNGIDVLRQVVNRAPFTEAHYHLAEGYLRSSRPFPEEAQEQLKLALAAYEAAAKTQPVDPALKGRIEAANARAAEMIRSKSGGAPGAN